MLGDGGLTSGGGLSLSGGLSLGGGGLTSGGSTSLLGGLTLGGGSSGGLSGTFVLGGVLSVGEFLSVGNFFLVFSGLLLSVFFEDLLVVSLGLSGSFPSGLLVSLVNSLSSESVVSDESLDLGGLSSDGLAFLFDLSSDNKSSNVIILGQGEELSDLSGSLGSESLGDLVVGQTFDIGFTLLLDGDSDDTEIRSDDAASDGLSFSFTLSSGSVAGLASTHKKSDSTLDEDTLFHGETVLIVTTGNFEDVSLEFITESVTFDFLAHSFTVEDGKLLVIIDADSLLAASSGAGDVKFHAILKLT